ncbi:cation transport ATPase PacS [Candidatus Termititenax aidoneus]|uniref:Cation transport ATPase PacS n=1 Tax=Termititenax aidoneus TaxID=2218524 RepID=A0A388T8S4_TERA1|nr:cation transport ATPase PacS [Candidatus Termititenax aidoneus]
MYLKIVAADVLEAEKIKFHDIAKTTGAVAGGAYAAFIFSLPLLIHYGSGNLGGQISEVRSSLNLGILADAAQNVSLFKIHSSGTLGLVNTIGLTLASFYGFGLVKDAVQNLRLPRFTLSELQTKFSEFNNIDQKLFALQTGVQDQNLLEQIFDLLKKQEVLAPLGADLYTVNAQNCAEEIYAALFDLGLTIGQTDAVMAYLRHTAEQNAELFFRRSLLGAQKLLARAALLPPNKQRQLAQAVFQEQLTSEREEAFLQFLRTARRRTVSIDTQIALSIALPFFVSMYNFISGDYIPCCPIHQQAIQECLGTPWQNYGGALPGLAEAAFLAVMHGQLSHVLEKLAENKTRKALARVMNSSQLAKEYITLQDGRQTLTPLENIAPQSTLVLKKGQQLPVDAVALQQMTVSESHMTGESVPVLKMPGQTVLSGAIVLDDTAQAQALRTYADSALAQQEKQIQQAIANKSAAEDIVEAFSRKWSPAMSLFSSGYFMYGVLSANMFAIKNALTILVATTPCGVQTALPTAKLALISRLAKDRIILRDPKALAAAGKTQIIVFDKTDTLTDSSHLSIRGLHYTVDGAPEQDLPLLYAVEFLAAHSIAEKILEYIGPQTQRPEIRNFQDLGKAVQGTYTADGQEHTISVGSLKYLRGEGLLSTAETTGLNEDAVVMVVDGQARLYFEYAETLRADAVDTILALQKTGQRIVIASGDSRQRVQAAVELLNKELLARGAKPLPDTDIHAELRPEEKTALVRNLQKDQNGGKQYVTMVGDGNNDSGALAAADFGISWNAKGLARNAAHALVTDGSQLSKVVDILQMSRQYSRNMLQNILLSTIGNALVIGGVVTGYTGLAFNYVGNLFSNSVGRMLRTMDMFISMLIHEGLTIGSAFNAARLGRKPKIKAQNKDTAESP